VKLLGVNIPGSNNEARAVRKKTALVEAKNNLARAQIARSEIATQKKATRARLKAVTARDVALSTYAAAKRDRTNADWRAKRGSADMAIIPDEAWVNARARQSCRDDWSGKSSRSGFVRYVIGTGITARARARDLTTGKLNKPYNKATNTLWKRWIRDPLACDIEGRKDFLGIQRIIGGEVFAVGGVLVRPVIRTHANNVGLTIQLIEREQLDKSKTSNNDNEIRGGVEVNEFGAPVAYWVFTNSHPLETYRSESERIPADEIYDVMDPTRVRQTGAISAMTAALIRQHNLAMYDEFELIAKKYESCIGVAVTEDPTRGPDDPLGGIGAVDPPAKDNTEIEVVPGMVIKRGPGETVDLLDPKRPGNGYKMFTDQQIAQIAAGSGLDYATVARLYDKGNFSSQRQGLLDMWAEHDPIAMMIVNVALRPIWEMFITVAVLEGKLDAPGFFTDDALRAEYLEASWGLTPKTWIDPAKQGAGKKLQLDMGTTSQQRITNELGVDLDEILDEREEYRDELNDRGLIVAGVNAPAKTSPSEPRPVRRPNGENGDDDDQDDGSTDDDDGLSDAIAKLVLEYSGV